MYKVKLFVVALIAVVSFTLGCSKSESNSICGMWRCEYQFSFYSISGYTGPASAKKVFKNIVFHSDGTGYRVGNDNLVSCEFTWKQSRDTVYFSYPKDCDIRESKLVIDDHTTDNLVGFFYDEMRNNEYQGEVLRISTTVLKR